MDPSDGVQECIHLPPRHPSIDTLVWLDDKSNPENYLKFVDHSLSSISCDPNGRYFCLTEGGRVFVWTPEDEPQEVALPCQFVISLTCSSDCLYFINDRGKIYCTDLNNPEKLQQQIPIVNSPSRCCSHGYYDDERVSARVVTSGGTKTFVITESGQVLYWSNESYFQVDAPRLQPLLVPSSVGPCHSLTARGNFCCMVCENGPGEDKSNSPTSSSGSLNAFDPKFQLKQSSSVLDNSWQILFKSRTKKDNNVPLLPLSSAAKSHTSIIESSRKETENTETRCPHCRADKILPASQQSSTTDSTLTLDDALENGKIGEDSSQLNDAHNATVLKEVWSKVDSLVRQSSTAIFPNTDSARQFLSKQLSVIQIDEDTKDILKENVNHVASVVAQSVKNVGEQVHRFSKHWSASSSADEDLEPEFGTDIASVPLRNLNDEPETRLSEREAGRCLVRSARWSQESPSCLSLDSYVTQQAQKEAQLEVESNPECQKSFIASTLRQLSKRGFRRLNTCVLFANFEEEQPTQNNIPSLNQKGVHKVVAGEGFSLALSWDGTAFLSLMKGGKVAETWPVKLPVRPEAPVTFRDIAAGENHALLLSDKGEVFVMRPNSDEKTQCVRLTLNRKNNQHINYVLAAGRISLASLKDSDPFWNDLLTSERLFLHSLVEIWCSLIQVLPKTSPSDQFGVREALFDSYKQILGLVTENVASLVHGKAGLLLWAEPILAGWKEYSQSVCQALVMNGFQLNKSDSAVVEQAWPSLWPLLLDTQLRKTSSPFQVLMVEPLNRLKAYIGFLKSFPNKEQLSLPEKERWNAIEEQYEDAFRSHERECQSADFTRAFWDSVPVKLFAMLATPQRRLLRESRSQPLQLHQAHRFTSHWFVLFTDILVHVQYSTHATYALETLWVEPLPDLEATHMKHALSLVTPEESLVVTCPTAVDKVEWLLALQAAIKACLGDKREGTSRPSPPLARHASYAFSKGSYKDAVYSGMWLCGKLQGHGELRWPDGRCYKGNFRQGLRHGLGRLDTPTVNGTVVYEGQWREDKQTGYAVLQYANGDVYEGYFKDGLPQGHGSLKKGHLLTSAASVYVGEWEAGLRQGYGVLDDISAGEKYMGMWFADAKHGPAVVVTLDGLYMEGTFQNNKMIGEALLLFEDGSTYEGEVSAPGVFAGKGVLQWPRGDKLEGTFTGAWSEGIKVSGVLHKAVAASSMSNSIDRFSFGSHPLPSSLGQLCVPAHRKWESMFRHGYQVLGLPYPCYSPINPSLTAQAWDQVAVLISQAKTMSSSDLKSFKTSTAEPNMTRVRRGSGSAAWIHKWREWSKAERLEGLEKIPQCARTTLTYEEYKETQAYLAKAFDCPLHPLGRLLCHLVDVYRATYVGIGAHARLLSQAVAELRSILSRLYGLVRVLFPALPLESQPLSLSSGTEPDAEVVTASSLLFPFLLPRLYPPLFTLYALANEKADELYWDRLVKWNRQGDYALFAFLGIDQKFWSPNSPGDEQHTELHFNATVESLQQLSTTFCPQEKLLVIQNTFQEINKAVESRLGPNYLWTMDDLFPIFQFVVVRARIRHLGSEIHLMDDLMEKHVQLGELGIMFTTLKACYFQIQHEKMNFS